ncbi:MAG: hypothetical protein AAGF12_28700 [Myxococcota bacterium]
MKRLAALAWMLVSIIGCGDDASPTPDADVGLDATVDANVAPDAETSDATVDRSLDAVADATVDAMVDAEPPCEAPRVCDPGPYNYAFVSSEESLLGEVGGPAGADATCNRLASAAGLPGRYIGWVSSSAVSARDRLGDASGWIRTDLRPVATNREDLFQGRLKYLLDVDENGNRVAPGPTATGTAIDGTATEENCEEWTTSEPTARLIGGSPIAGGRFWSMGFLNQCSQRGRIYCFGVDQNRALPDTGVAGRVAFISNTVVPGDGGLNAADTACAQDATDAGLLGQFQALLPADGMSAISRFDLAGAPWVRPDGMPIFASPGDWATEAQPLLPILLAADGTYLRGLVWSGAESQFATPDNYCENWSTTSAAVQSRMVRSDLAGESWFGSGSGGCDRSANRVFCLER